MGATLKRGVGSMKVLASVLLMVLAFELSAAGGVCARFMHRAHDCCSSSQEAPALPSSSQPVCCMASLVVDNNLVSETEGSRSLIAPALDSPIVPSQLPHFTEVNAGVPSHPLAQAIPPPLSPLRQSCLLLI